MFHSSTLGTVTPYPLPVARRLTNNPFQWFPLRPVRSQNAILCVVCVDNKSCQSWQRWVMPNLAVIYMPDTHTHVQHSLTYSTHTHTQANSATFKSCLRFGPRVASPPFSTQKSEFMRQAFSAANLVHPPLAFFTPNQTHPTSTHSLLSPSVTLTRSSEASAQSGSPSQTQRLAMQAPLEQVCSATASHGTTGQLRSSLPSPQSSSWSHTQRFWMQPPLPQVNSSERHVWSVTQWVRRERERERERK